MFRLAIFDFDGTLADTANWFFGALNEGADRFGYRKVSEQELETLRGLTNREILRHLQVPMTKLPSIARHFRAEASRCLHQMRLFSEARDSLMRLSTMNVQVGIVSSNSEANIRAILGHETAALVSHYGCGSSLFGKAAKLRRMIRRCGVQARETLAIGDETRDIEAAKAVGAAAGAVLWGFANRSVLERSKADFLFEDFAALLAAFERRRLD